MRRAGLATLLLLFAAACTKDEPAPHRTEPWLANPSGSSSAKIAALAPQDFHFVADSKVRFSVQGRKGKLSGSAPVSAGELHLDVRDLKSASASLDVDLTKLVVDDTPPEGVELGASSPSAAARAWLELGPAVPTERRSQFATARFELASVDDPSLPFIDFAAKNPHHVRATAVGTLLIHGFKEPVRAAVVLEPQKTPAGAPLRLSIRSAAALVVALAPHDITARGAGGIADALAAARASDWVGKSVRLEFELVAETSASAAK